MQKFSFLKGLVIAGFLSSLFWVGLYYALTDNSTPSSDIEIQKKIAEPSTTKEVTEVKASL